MNKKSNKFTIQHQHLDLKIDLEKKQVTGICKLDIKSKYYLPYIRLEGRQYTIQKAQVSTGTKVTKVLYKSKSIPTLNSLTDSLIVKWQEKRVEESQLGEWEFTLPKDAKFVRVFTLILHFTVSQSTPGLYFGDHGVWTTHENGEAGSWFPCLDQLNHRCLWTIEIKTVQSMGMIMVNGQTDQEIYKTEIALPARYISFFIGDGENRGRPVNSVENHILAYIPSFWNEKYTHQKSPATKWLESFSPCIEFLNQQSLCQPSSISWIVSETLVDDFPKVNYQWMMIPVKYLYTLQDSFLWEKSQNMIAWGLSYIYCLNTWKIEHDEDNWILYGLSYVLKEGYLKKIFGEAHHDFRHLETILEFKKEEVNGVPLYWKGYTHASELYNMARMKKAGIVMTMIMKKMGWELFQKCWSLFTPQSSLSTAELLQTCKFLFRAGLWETFFEQWVYSKDYPDFKTDFKFLDKKGYSKIEIQQNSGWLFSGAMVCCAVDKISGPKKQKPKSKKHSLLTATPVEIEEKHKSNTKTITIGNNKKNKSYDEIDITCSSHVERNRKRRRMEIQAEEKLSLQDRLPRYTQYPVKWVEADIYQQFFYPIIVDQDLFMYIYQLVDSHSVTSQMKALLGIQKKFKKNHNKDPADVSLVTHSLKTVYHKPQHLLSIRLECLRLWLSLNPSLPFSETKTPVWPFSNHADFLHFRAVVLIYSKNYRLIDKLSFTDWKNQLFQWMREVHLIPRHSFIHLKYYVMVLIEGLRAIQLQSESESEDVCEMMNWCLRCFQQDLNNSQGYYLIAETCLKNFGQWSYYYKGVGKVISWEKWIVNPHWSNSLHFTCWQTIVQLWAKKSCWNWLEMLKMCLVPTFSVILKSKLEYWLSVIETMTWKVSLPQKVYLRFQEIFLNTKAFDLYALWFQIYQKVMIQLDKTIYTDSNNTDDRFFKEKWAGESIRDRKQTARFELDTIHTKRKRLQSVHPRKKHKSHH